MCLKVQYTSASYPAEVKPGLVDSSVKQTTKKLICPPAPIETVDDFINALLEIPAAYYMECVQQEMFQATDSAMPHRQPNV